MRHFRSKRQKMTKLKKKTSQMTEYIYIALSDIVLLLTLILVLLNFRRPVLKLAGALGEKFGALEFEF